MNQQATIDAPETTGVLDQFQTDLIAGWRRLPNKGFFLSLLAAWLAVFLLLGNSIQGYIHTPSLFAWMYEAYNSPNAVAENDRHGNFIPFLVLGLLWWKRKELAGLPLRIWLPGLAILAAGMVLHVVGFMLQEPRISVVALFVGIYGLMGLAWGLEWLKNIFFPFFLFLFCIPQGDLLQPLTFRLQLLVCWLVEFVGHWVLGIDVVRVGTQLYNPSGHYQYEVAAACSGIRSLMVILLLTLAYGFLNFRSWPKRLVMAAMAFPFAVLGNLLRMLCIIVAAQIWGREGGDYVHEGGPLGLLSLVPYVPAFFGVFYIGRLLEEKRGADPK